MSDQQSENEEEIERPREETTSDANNEDASDVGTIVGNGVLLSVDAESDAMEDSTEQNSEPRASSDGEGGESSTTGGVDRPIEEAVSPSLPPTTDQVHHQVNRNRDPPVFSSAYGLSTANLHVYKCSECNYETYNLAALTSHQKTHKMYQCDVCQMKFSHSANMRRHRMRHTGYKPFECQVCHKRFFRKDHMTEHMVTHSKQLQLHCPLCDKTFHRQVYFKAHLQAEHWNVPGDKACRICGHKSATIKGAKLHYTTRHATPLLMGLDLELDSKQQQQMLMDSSLMSQSPDSSHNNNNMARNDVLSGFLMPPIMGGAGGGGGGGCSGVGGGGGGGGGSGSGGGGDVDETSRGMSILESLRNNVHSSNPRSLLSPPRYLHRNSISLHRISNSNTRSRQSGGGQSPRSDIDVSPLVVVKMEVPDDPQGSNSSDDNNGDDQQQQQQHQQQRNSGELFLERLNNSLPSQSSSAFQAPLMPTNSNHSDTCSPNSTLDPVRLSGGGGGGGGGRRTCSPSTSQASSVVAAAAFASVSSVLHRQVNVGDLSITPVGGVLICVHCGIVFPDQTLYFLHKGVHSENNPWKCNICGEPCRDKYDFNTHILSKAHQ